MFELAEILPCQSSTTSHSHHCRCILAVCKDHPGYDKHVSKCRTSYLNSRTIILPFIPGSGIDQVHGGSDEPANCAGCHAAVTFPSSLPTTTVFAKAQHPALPCRPETQHCNVVDAYHAATYYPYWSFTSTILVSLFLDPTDLRISISLQYSPTGYHL